jgi:DNA-binding CsgD family transcriptional regulator
MMESAADVDSFRVGLLAGLLLQQQPAVQVQELGLTERQSELAVLVAQGMSNAEVGERLGIAPATVKKHLEQVYHRLGVSNRTQLAVLLMRH